MLKAKVLQEQGKTQQEIAVALGVTDRTVRNYLNSSVSRKERRKRKSKLDKHKALVDSILDDSPFFNRELLYERIKRAGYSGHISILRDYASAVTRRITKAAAIRFETEPGRQAQVDWKEFGAQVVDGKKAKLYAFVMVMGYSRKPFVYFTISMNQATMLACHILAFAYFGGVPFEILYDNMRTAYAPDSEGIWQVTKRLLALAVHYGFVPQRCKIRRPETKGKVERTVGYLDNNFWPRMEGRELSLGQLNAEVNAWIDAISTKNLADFGESRAQRFERERPALKPLPADDFDVREELPLHVGREGTVRYEGNRYTVPAMHIGELASLLVHPLHRGVELRLPGGMSRTFTLAAAGSHSRVEFPGDRTSQLKRWESDRERTARRRQPRRRRSVAPAAAVEVEVRSTSTYEALADTMNELAEASV